MKRPKRPGRGHVFSVVMSKLLKLFSKSDTFRREISLCNDLLRYELWLKSNFELVKIQNCREDVWREIAECLKTGEKKVNVIELGVAWGYIGWWWLTNYESMIEKWDGFDRFTGLPKSWRELQVGTFDAEGRTPNIGDKRFSWHVGDVEKTILPFGEMRKEAKSDTRSLVFFDLDLFEPSLSAWESLQPSIKPGDILYFDEAFDENERRLIDEQVLPIGKFRLVSANWMSLALEVLEIYY